MGLTIVTPPTAEPFTTAEAKAHLKVETSDDDTLIDRLVKAARRDCESRTERALITQTWDWFFDELPEDGDPLWVPLPRLVSVTTFKYYDTAGVQQTWSSANYIVDTSEEPGRICQAYDVDWPDTQERANALEIRFVAGYGAASAVDEDLKIGMLLKIGAWYEQRSDVIDGVPITALPEVVAADRLYQMKRARRLP